MAIPADDGAARLMVVATSRTDRESFEEFYATHRASIGRALSVTLRDDHLASEALDEAMVRAYQRWGEVRQLASPTGWVYTVALNWSRSIRRRSMRSGSIRDNDQSSVGPHEVVNTDIHRALRDLSVGQRAVVVCRYLIGYSELETARVLGIRPGTVKSRLHRALDHLRSALAETDAADATHTGENGTRS